MMKHGTSFPGWYIAFQAKALLALPRPPEIGMQMAENWWHSEKELEESFRKALIPPKAALPPKENTWFQLDIAASRIDPMLWIKDWWQEDFKQWKLVDPITIPDGVYRAKLVTIGGKRADGVDEVLRIIQARYGKKCKLLPFHGIESFSKQYPWPDGKGPIAFGGTVWKNQNHGLTLIPVLKECGNKWGRDPSQAGGTFTDYHRWAIYQ